MSTVALGMICKGTGHDPEHLDRCLQSVAPHVDALYITLTGPREELAHIEDVCKRYNAVVSYSTSTWTATQEAVDWLTTFFGYEPSIKVGDEIFLFDDARNFNMNKIPQDYAWMLWLDTDDVLVHGEKIKDVIQTAEQRKLESVYFNYIYQADFEGDKIKHIIIEHLRERLIRNNGAYKWVAPIHETLIEQRQTLKSDDPRCTVVHMADLDKRMEALYRNLKNLEYSVWKTEGKDPRPIYYLAKAYYDLRTREYDLRSEKLIMMYLLGEHKSGWQEERAQAWEYLAEIYRRNGEYNNAVKAGMNALMETPEFPTTYINIAVTYMIRQEWERALFWARMASHVPDKKTTLINNPKDLQARTLQVIYESCLHLNMLDEAWAAATKMLQLIPEDEYAQKSYEFVNMIRQEKLLTKNIVELSTYLIKSGEAQKVKALLSAAPQLVANNPFIADLRKKTFPPKQWEDDEIALFCGPGFTNWSPTRLTDPQGSFVGGSEEAVILLSQALQKKGWRVTVYADPGIDEGEHDGVQWLPYYRFNWQDGFNILIFWRVVQHLDQSFTAKKTYVWCHDIQNNLDYSPERINKLTKAFFLSQWHRDNVPNLPEEKVMITSNGI